MRRRAGIAAGNFELLRREREGERVMGGRSWAEIDTDGGVERGTTRVLELVGMEIEGSHDPGAAGRWQVGGSECVVRLSGRGWRKWM